jgi:glycosyltransferase involved in cell wall biosynthesis
MSSIDVVVPCYQYGRFLRDSVGSILKQPVKPLRVLIIDNASTDNSLEVAQQLASEDSRVEIISHKSNLGQQASFNEGIEWASADYFMILDADDLLAQGCLARAISIMDRDTSLVFCHGVERCIVGEIPPDLDRSDDTQDANWRISTGIDFIRRLCSKGYNFVGNPTVVRRTSAQKTIGHYDTSLKYANDMNMWLRLATLGNVAETTAVQGMRRVHSGQMTEFYRDNPVFDLVEHLSNFQHFFLHEGAEIPNSTNEYRRVVKRIAFNAMYMGVTLIPKGRGIQSLKCLEFAVRTYLGSRNRTPIAKGMSSQPEHRAGGNKTPADA